MPNLAPEMIDKNQQKIIKSIVTATAKEAQLNSLSQEKRMRSRKYISWFIWFLITATSLYMVFTSRAGALDINLVIKMFGTVTVIYILGNVFEKFVMLFASKLAEIIGKKIESFLDDNKPVS